jgi:uncharacterized protein (DUF488 family)
MPVQHAVRLYTLGYSGWKLDALTREVEQYDAVLFDIRFSPASWQPQWSRSQLQKAFPGRYVHVTEFGNRNYRGGPMAIVNYKAGKELAAYYLREVGSVILMCVCEGLAACHRLPVSRRLEEDLGLPPTTHLERPRGRG